MHGRHDKANVAVMKAIQTLILTSPLHRLACSAAQREDSRIYSPALAGTAIHVLAFDHRMTFAKLGDHRSRNAHVCACTTRTCLHLRYLVPCLAKPSINEPNRRLLYLPSSKLLPSEPHKRRSSARSTQTSRSRSRPRTTQRSVKHHQESLPVKKYSSPHCHPHSPNRRLEHWHLKHLLLRICPLRSRHQSGHRLSSRQTPKPNPCERWPRRRA